MKLSHFALAFLLLVTTIAPVKGQTDDCSTQKNRFRAPDNNGNCITSWANQEGTLMTYPDDFDGILSEAKIYRCPSSNKRVIISNGIPDHDLVIQQNNNGACEIPYAIEMPLDPVYDSTTPISEIPVRGMIAMAKNGVPAYGPQESDSLNAVEATESNKTDAGYWYGHRGVDSGWHFHNPHMGTEVVTSTTFLGYAMDGFAIYGPLSDLEVQSLDECNGLLSLDGSYRYHVRTLDQVDNTTEYCRSGYNSGDPLINWKYILGCYAGNIDNTNVVDASTYTLDEDCVEDTGQIIPSPSPTPTPTKAPTQPTGDGSSRPNIIIMQPDDLVFMDQWGPPPNNPETPNSANTIPPAGMPHIEALRTGGLQMKQAYTASPMCGTSRYSTITGKMPARSTTIREDHEAQPSDITIPNTKLEGEDCTTENLAVTFKDAGYATAMVGKWHLSKINRNNYQYDSAVETVQGCGFDHVGGLYVENMDDEDDGFNNFSDGTFSHNMEWITHEAINFINTTTDEPFFLYFNPTVPHGSRNVLDALENFTCTDTANGSSQEEPWIKGMSEDAGCEAYRTTVIDRANGDYAALGKIWVDDAVGALVQALKDNGVYENTIFLFQEDHGMDAKGTLYENGIRIPQFVHYPAKIPAGTTLDVPVSTVDIAATMIDYAGIDEPPYLMDGMSWKDVIGNEDRESFWKNERCLYFEADEDRAVRCGCYKYLDIFDTTTETYLQGLNKGMATDIGGILFDLCDGTDDYITAQDNNRERHQETVTNTAVQADLAETLDCYLDNTDPSLDPAFGACGATEAPSPVPTPNPTECTTDDGREGLVFELEVQLDATSGSEFGWELINEINESIGWEGNPNIDLSNNAHLRYSMCVPKYECWILKIFDNGGDGLCCNNGDGYYNGYVAGEEIFSGGDFSGTEEEHEICIGREYCEDATRGFKYKLKNKNRKKKAKCTDVDEERGRRRKKICKATYGDSARKKVQQLCLETCGKVGLGSCNFLETYGDNPTPTPAPTDLVKVDPIIT